MFCGELLRAVFSVVADYFAGVAVAFDVGVVNQQANALAGRIGIGFATYERYNEIITVANVPRKVLTDDFDIGGQCLYVENSCCRTIVGYTYNDGGIVVVGDYAVGSEYGLDIGQRLHTRKENGGKPYSEQRN